MFRNRDKVAEMFQANASELIIRFTNQWRRSGPSHSLPYATYTSHRVRGNPLSHEHAMLLMPADYPSDDAKVPDLQRKEINEVSEFFE